MNTNLLTCTSHHRRWMETFHLKLTTTIKQKLAAGIVHSTCRFSDVIPDGEDNPLYKHLGDLPKLCKTMIAENLPTACVGVAATKHALIIHFPSLITTFHNQHDNSTFYPDDIVDKMNDMVITGFRDFNLHRLNACDFPIQCLYVLATQVSKKKQEGFSCTIPLLTIIASNVIFIDKSLE